MDDVECPYCEKSQEIDHDGGYGYEEDKTYEQECSDCEKVFAFTTSISFYHEAEKAECLNGGDHLWKKSIIYPGHWPDAKWCTACGKKERGKFVELS